MGCLKDPERRKKYGREELIDLIMTYESIQHELNQMEDQLRTQKLSKDAKRQVIESRDSLITIKNKVFNEQKLRQTIVAGIPCNYSEERG